MKAFFLKTLLSVFLLVSPLWAFAQQAAHTSSGLVPCGAVSGFRDIFGATECGLCDLVKLFGNINNFLLGVTIPLSIALFAWAGVMYFAAGGNPKQIIRAHRIFKSVVIGFIIALAAWLIVQTVLNALVDRNFFTSGSWNTLDCADDSQRKRDSNISDIFGFITGNTQGGGGGPVVVGNTTSNTGSGGGGGGRGESTTMQVIGPDGVVREVTFNASLPDASLNSQFLNVSSKYGDQINTACQGSSLPNCSFVVTALIGAESSGNAQTGCNGFNACGLMQLTADKGGRSCAVGENACIADQINKGVQLLTNIYNNPVSKQSVFNTLAGYNGGVSTVPGTSVTGRNPALAASVDCPGMYAWQCATNPGGLTDTQKYVATICRTVKNGGASC